MIRRTRLNPNATIADSVLRNGSTAAAVSDKFGGTFTPYLMRPPYIYRTDHLARWSQKRFGFYSRRVEITMIGDSTTQGVGGDGAGAGVENILYVTNSVAGQLRSRLTTMTGVDPGEGYIFTNDYRWSLAGGATRINTNPSGPLMCYITLTSAAQSTTIVVDGSDIKVCGRGGGSLTRPSITVDGHPVTMNTWVTGQNVQAAVTGGIVTGDGTNVGSGSHTVVITGGASPGSRISGIIARKNVGTGIGIHRLGIGGLTAATAGGETLITSDRALLMDAQFGNVVPDLAIVQYGINDYFGTGPGTQVTKATFKQNLQYMITDLEARGAAIILSDANDISSVTSNGSLTREDYSAAMRELADANPNTAYLSMPSLLGTYAEANARGLMITGSAHPNQYGYGAEAAGLYDVLFAPELLQAV